MSRNIPLQEKFLEFEMLDSDTFIKSGHAIKSLCIKNHRKSDVEIVSSHKLPKGLTLYGDKDSYAVTTLTTKRIELVFCPIPAVGGVEAIQKFIKKEHKGIDFLVQSILTQTISNGEAYTCRWFRSESGPNRSGIFSLRLKTINSKNALKNYTDLQLKKIAGSFSDGTCNIVPGTDHKKEKVLCYTPLTY